MRPLLLLAVLALPLHAQDKAQRDSVQDVPFNGIITDLTGNPVKGARIYTASPKCYARSNRKGHFGLTNVQADDTLHILYKRTVYAVPVEGRKSVRIHLGDQITSEEDDQLTDWGYGFVKRRESLEVSSGISGEELVRTGRSNLLEALQGRIPGLNIGPITAPGREPSVHIRGINSINLPITPLFIVDGIIVDTLEFLTVYEVDHVEVLKDATIYGARGANGAILVTTKR